VNRTWHMFLSILIYIESTARLLALDFQLSNIGQSPIWVRWMVPEGSTAGGAKTWSIMQQMTNGSVPFWKLVLLILYDQDHACMRADTILGGQRYHVVLTVPLHTTNPNRRWFKGSKDTHKQICQLTNEWLKQSGLLTISFLSKHCTPEPSHSRDSTRYPSARKAYSMLHSCSSKTNTWKIDIKKRAKIGG